MHISLQRVMLAIKYLLFFNTILLTCSSCLFQKQVLHGSRFVEVSEVPPLYIAMIANQFVFDNLSPIIYQEVSTHFKQRTFTLMNEPQKAYQLLLAIKSFTPHEQFISPDLLVYSKMMYLDLDVRFVALDGTLIASKIFMFSTLISRAKNPILDKNFLDYEYKRFAKKIALSLEYYVRQSWSDYKQRISDENVV